MSRLLTKADILYALAFTPYDAANPAGYVDPTYFNAHLPALAAPKDSPAFTGPYSFAGQGTFLGLLDVQSGALNLNNIAPRLLMGRAGSASTPNLDFLAGAAAGRSYDARITVSGGSSLLDGKGVINLVCNALTINGQSIATSGVGAPGTALPLMNAAVALVGVGTAFAREDHVHPSDTSRLAINAAGTITDGANATNTLTISNTGSNGAKLKLVGNGATTPSKTLRVQSGSLALLNDAGTASLLTVTDAGTTTVGSAAQSGVVLALNAAATTNRTIEFQTASSSRWKLFTEATAEGGANAGSNLQINRYDDSGTFLSAALTLSRATGQVTLGGALAISGALTGVSSLAMGGALSGVTTLTLSGALTGNTGKFNANANSSAPTLGGNVYAVGADATVPRIGSDSFGLPGSFSVRRANGTGASSGQSALANNDVILQLEGRGYGATGYGSAARGQINIAAGAAWTDTDQSAYLAFITTAVGGTTTSEKMRLSAAGRLLINSTTDNGTDALQVAGSASVNADPTTALQLTPKQYVDARLGTRRNLIHNGLFRVNQRGTASVTSNGLYPADRWLHLDNAAGSRTIAVTTLVDADRTAIGDENAINGLNIQTTGSAGTGDYELMHHHLEGVDTGAGKTVTVSFWAKAAAGGQPIAVELSQLFGSGGSPSAGVTGIGSTKFALTTSWARYSATVAVPSIIGKTLGTAGGDHVQLIFWTSGGSSFNSRNGSIGQQTSNITLWGVQLEIAPAATPVEKLPLVDDLDQCRRYFQIGYLYAQAAPGAGVAMSAAFYGRPMRATPTAALFGTNGSSNLGSITLTPLFLNGMTGAAGVASATAGGLAIINTGVSLSADI